MLNTITIMGRMVRDPEIRKTGNGTSVLNFTLAVDRDYTDDNGDRETDFIDCVAWAHTADFVGKYFSKGDLMVVNGRLQLRVWDDDGNRRRAAEIKVDNVYFGGSKCRESDEQKGRASNQRNNQNRRRGGK